MRFAPERITSAKHRRRVTDGSEDEAVGGLAGLGLVVEGVDGGFEGRTGLKRLHFGLLALIVSANLLQRTCTCTKLVFSYHL